MRTFDYDGAARALVDAAFSSDREAALKHGVSERSIREWRKRQREDNKLAVLFHRKKELAEADWASELPAAIRAGIQFILRAAREANHQDPEAIHAVAGALKIATEVAITSRIINARLALAGGEDSKESRELAAEAQRLVDAECQSV